MAKAETLSKDQVLHLAKLARLELTMDEVERYTNQLGDVLGYVAKLQDLKASDTKSGLTQPVELRADVVTPWVEPGSLIEQSPKHHDNLIEVPAVFTDRE